MKFSVLINFCFVLSSCVGPQQNKTENAKVETTGTANLEKEFEDKGNKANGIKLGYWIEYTIDTLETEPITVIRDNAKSVAQLPQTYLNVKSEGNYINGFREGKWLFYSEFTNSRPVIWVKKAEINYAHGKKHGREINFRTSGDTLSVSSYFNGQEQGLGKQFHLNHPFGIWKVYNVVDGKYLLLKEYYPSGNLKIVISENKESDLNLYQGFFENGMLMINGNIKNHESRIGKWKTYYDNGNLETEVEYQNDKMDGNYELYHQNGQLWSERIYRNGKLWEVISNFDKQGNKKDKGTLKNGNGTVKLYNSNGELLGVEKYSQGAEI